MLINPRIAAAATPSASTLADQIVTSQRTRRPHINRPISMAPHQWNVSLPVTLPRNT